MTVQRLWLLIQEPRVVTAVTGVGWAILATIGLMATIFRPISIDHPAGPALTWTWAGFFMLGGTLGLLGCLPGWWWVERSGIVAGMTGTLIFLVVTISAHQATGPKITSVGLLLLVVVMLTTRWFRIRGPQVDPMRGMGRRHDD